MLKKLELSGFKSFPKKTILEFKSPITAIVGPNGSGKSNVAEAFSFVLGEQSMKSMRGRRGEDLIWNGSNTAPRSSRAYVRICLDNREKELEIEFDEVVIERIVHRDATNQYLINGSDVRLKDIVELLSGANIGPSGHHIIAQGEADKILNMSGKERRVLIEDALGLKVFQMKRKDAEKKLERTRENIKEVELMRREIKPHIKFLEKQVERIEKTLKLKEDLKAEYKDYLKRESVYLKSLKRKIKSEAEEPQRMLRLLGERIEELSKGLEKDSWTGRELEEMESLERKISSSRNELDGLYRELGRVEGLISSLERRESPVSGSSIPESKIRELKNNVISALDDVDVENIASFRRSMDGLKERISTFFDSLFSDGSYDDTGELDVHKSEKRKLEEKIEDLKKKEEKLEEEHTRRSEGLESLKDSKRDNEKEIYKLKSEQNEHRLVLNDIKNKEERLREDERNFKEELSEAGILAGREVVNYEDHEVRNSKRDPVPEDFMVNEPREKQQERRRDIEKKKLRIEELGGGRGEEIMNEYREVTERDQFLGSEVEDLKTGEERLVSLIEELEKKVERRFRDGLEKINGQFQDFFSLMFDGGSARLKLEREMSEESEEGESLENYGIEIDLNLPKKKIRGLMMLSGGERALTSIALIFAMSQINPPPFLVLDETDAALDEANSKKYGDMIKDLSKRSELILVTHNRETMSRADVLYGVTMGGDGVSKLLSVSFKEAEKVAN